MQVARAQTTVTVIPNEDFLTTILLEKEKLNSLLKFGLQLAYTDVENQAQFWKATTNVSVS